MVVDEKKYNTILAPPHQAVFIPIFFNKKKGNNIPSLPICAGRGCFFRLRCILVGFKINYQIKNLSKLINMYRSYTSKAVVPECKRNLYNVQHKINPWFLTGFLDGEGCFLISISKKESLKIGWTVQLMFKITLHQKDKNLLEHIVNYFGVGRISKHGTNSIQYHVHSVKDLQVIIYHCEKFGLITHKLGDYELWRKAFNLIINKEHLTIGGLHKIVAIKASLNRGLSSELKFAFPSITPIDRPLVTTTKKTFNPNWLAGFSSAEGSFMIKTNINTSQVYLRFQLTQHVRDE